MNTEDNKYRIAKKRVEGTRRFYIHLVTYVFVNFFLFLINITTSPDVLWFYWPLLGWGIGMVMHAVRIFGVGRWFGPDWEENKIKEFIE